MSDDAPPPPPPPPVPAAATAGEDGDGDGEAGNGAVLQGLLRRLGAVSFFRREGRRVAGWKGRQPRRED